MRGAWPRVVASLALGLTVGAAIYALADSNTVPASKAGDGAGAISGYAVSGVSYTLNLTNPQNIDAVAFTLDSAASEVKVRLAPAGPWFSCSGGPSVTCDTSASPPAVASATELTVVAVQ